VEKLACARCGKVIEFKDVPLPAGCVLIESYVLCDECEQGKVEVHLN
jgi:Fe2+ or Zn2+ uptake regulation protein